MNEFTQTFLISLLVSCILDFAIEIIRCFQSTSNCKMKLQFGEHPENLKSEAEIIPINKKNNSLNI